jgi:mannose-1-phosphate guanylyltransferase
MKAVVLAGGEGTRLHPLTYTRPKSLIPILDRPMVEYTLEYFKDCVDDIVFAAGHMVEELRDFLSTIPEGSRVEVVAEEVPLGTGGAVKNVESLLDEPFIVLNADIISSFSMKDFIAFSREKGGMGSIALYPSSHPEDYGVVELEEGQRIVRFVEKPSPEEAFSNLINAGAYYLDPRILDLMEPGKFVSMEREIFPQIIDDGFYGYEFEGYWVDVGKVETYLEATRTLLQIRGSDINGQVDDSVQIIDPVYLESNSLIRSGRFGPNSSVGKGCAIGDAEISDSVLFNDVKVGDNVAISGSVLGEGVVVGDDCILKGCVVADGSRIDDEIELTNEKVGMR